MASRKVLLIAAAASAVVVGALLPATASGISYDVGDSDGWSLSGVYEDWISENRFEVYDELVFKYTPGKHNVVVVDEYGYKNCDASGADSDDPEQVLTTGEDTVSLDTAKTYYFICGMEGHCRSGMRLKIDVYSV